MPRRSTSEFLSQLSTNPESLEAFRENPALVGRFAGLSKPTLDALTSGDVAEIHKAVVDDLKDRPGLVASDIEVVIVIIV